ncbi:MAG: hypothetical protein L0Y44_05770 [Phycisphaerales bacterium]|nr:hypothetical protein [Phycisphaerales bacterium]MCI0630146.1 hypothetical protein [Phycisphaerales bacterium]
MRTYNQRNSGIGQTIGKTRNCPNSQPFLPFGAGRCRVFLRLIALLALVSMTVVKAFERQTTHAAAQDVTVYPNTSPAYTADVIDDIIDIIKDIINGGGGGSGSGTTP